MIKIAACKWCNSELVSLWLLTIENVTPGFKVTLAVLQVLLLLLALPNFLIEHFLLAAQIRPLLVQLLHV